MYTKKSYTPWSVIWLINCIFGATLLMNVYMIYYIKVYLDKFKMDPGWLESVDFSISFNVEKLIPDRFIFNPHHLDYIQSFLLFWTTFNDPILGFMQDLGFCGMKWITSRRKVLLYVGPALSISFLIFWFPWAIDDGLIVAFQLLFCQFFFDAFQVLIMSAYFGLCVEKFRGHEDRVRIFVYGEMIAGLAGFVVLPIETLTDSLERYNVFQVFVVGIALISGFCILFGSWNLKNTENEEKDEEEEDLDVEDIGQHWRSVVQISWQIIKEFRFISLVGSQFFKMLRYMANEQFLLIYVEILLADYGILQRGSTKLGLYYVFVRILGNILFLLLWIPVNKLGCQWVIQGINLVTLINCFVAYMAGSNNFWFIAIFIIIENTLSRCGWQGFYMIISGEVIDADREIYHRKLPFSTIIFTLKTLFTKPADQFASVVILGILETSAYNEFKTYCWPDSNTPTMKMHDFHPTGVMSINDLDIRCTNIKQTAFLALVILPAVCAICESLFILLDQFIVWRTKQNRYADKYLFKLKNYFF